MPSPPRATLGSFIKLARCTQWAKGAFVFLGPLYGLALKTWPSIFAVTATFFAFAFASSACYVFNDIADRDADRTHPRKRNRPVASGAISVSTARLFGISLIVLAIGTVFVLPMNVDDLWHSPRLLVAGIVAVYVANVLLYTVMLKHRVVADVISLSAGFVLRMLGGCAAVLVEPSSFLLNVTFFVAMFLALGKRLGERRSLGEAALAGREVQKKYSDDLLRMALVVTGVATLLTYSEYVQTQSIFYTRGINLLWLTMLPATYGLLRAMVLLERGTFDDPTEMAMKDRPIAFALFVFAGITVVLLLFVKTPGAMHF